MYQRILAYILFGLTLSGYFIFKTITTNTAHICIYLVLILIQLWQINDKVK